MDNDLLTESRETGTRNRGPLTWLVAAAAALIIAGVGRLRGAGLGEDDRRPPTAAEDPTGQQTRRRRRQRVRHRAQRACISGRTAAAWCRMSTPSPRPTSRSTARSTHITDGLVDPDADAVVRRRRPRTRSPWRTRRPSDAGPDRRGGLRGGRPGFLVAGADGDVMRVRVHRAVRRRPRRPVRRGVRLRLDRRCHLRDSARSAARRGRRDAGWGRRRRWCATPTARRGCTALGRAPRRRCANVTVVLGAAAAEAAGRSSTGRTPRWSWPTTGRAAWARRSRAGLTGARQLGRGRRTRHAGRPARRGSRRRTPGGRRGDRPGGARAGDVRRPARASGPARPRPLVERRGLGGRRPGRPGLPRHPRCPHGRVR